MHSRDMHTLKGFVRLLALLAVCHVAQSEDLTVTQPKPLEPPTIGPRGDVVFRFPTLGATTNGDAIFLWDQSGPDGEVNLFFSRLDQNGLPLDNPGRFLAGRKFSSGPTLVAPADSSYFVVYDRMNNRDTRQTDTLVTALSTTGARLFEPVLITSNVVKEYRATSNGRTLMMVYEGRSPEPSSLIYTLIGGNGAIVARGVVDNSSYPTTYDIASDGEDYLLVWQASVRGMPAGTPAVRATRFNGNSGAYKTIGVTTNNYGIWALGYGKNGYLLAAVDAASQQGFLQLDRDGKILKEAANLVTPFRPNTAIFPEGEGWSAFTIDVTGDLRSMRVTPTSAAIRPEISLYPTVANVYYSGYMPSETIVQPFGPGRYLVARNNGVSILTSTGATQALRPDAYAIQKSSRVVASPSGYLVAWVERKGSDVSLRGLRLARDGSPIDTHSFVITPNPTDPPICMFDGVDYVVGWQQYFDMSTHFARISPTGAPQLRTGLVTFPTMASPPPQINMVWNRGNLYVYTVPDATAESSLHLYTVSTSGQATSEVILHGQSLVSDGTNLRSIGSEFGEVYTWRVQPAVIPPESERQVIAVGNSAYGVSLRGALAVVWGDAGKWSYAYFTNGIEKFRSQTPLDDAPIVATSSDHLLAAARTSAFSHRVTFQVVNLVNGKTTMVSADLGAFESFDLDSAGTDFLGVTDSVNIEKNFVGSFWVSPAAPPGLAGAQLADSQLQATLHLDPARNYRIETSNDLINWRLLDNFSGGDQLQVPASGAEHTFIRAVLVPE